MTRKQTYQQALESSGIPSELASKAAEIVDRDDPNKPNLGRSKDEQELINQSIKFINK
ncbi:MAG: hypothetical protein RLZZ29_484 [Cyanobacteriota bacterium]|jgi:hypothetical protein